MSERIGTIGDTYEYTAVGRRLSGTDKMVFDELLNYSLTWPAQYHQFVAATATNEERSRWAYRGREIAESELPF